MITFKYKEESLGHSRGTIKRPVADISLKTRSNSWIEFHPYIDSGADITMIPLSLGRLLGFRVNEDKVEQIGGIRGSVPVVYIETSMKVGTLRFPVNITWSLIEEVPPLLGRLDIFDRFNITFKQRDGIVVFRKRR